MIMNLNKHLITNLGQVSYLLQNLSTVAGKNQGIQDAYVQESREVLSFS